MECLLIRKLHVIRAGNASYSTRYDRSHGASFIRTYKYVRTNIASGSGILLRIYIDFTYVFYHKKPLATEMGLYRGYSVTVLYLMIQGIPENIRHEVRNSRV